ncbi:hypothetical protein BJX96DRAFT_149359 [Aspergillus floccosus]
MERLVENVNRNNPFQPVSFACGIHSFTVPSWERSSYEAKPHSCPCLDLHVDPDPDQPAVLQQFIPELFRRSCLASNASLSLEYSSLRISRPSQGPSTVHARESIERIQRRSLCTVP